MKLIFGLQLDNHSLPRPSVGAGAHYLGPKGLLDLFEAWLGLGGHPNDIDYLRLEQFRQALLRHLAAATEPPFYQKSFEADPFTTAAEMLSRRDELLLTAWDFEKKADTPPRLATLAEIEQFFYEGEEGLQLSIGYADRFDAVLRALDGRELTLDEVWVNEPLELMPRHFQLFFQKIEAKTGLEIQQLHVGNPHQPLPAKALTDLQKFQHRIAAPKPGTEKASLKNV